MLYYIVLSCEISRLLALGRLLLEEPKGCQVPIRTCSHLGLDRDLIPLRKTGKHTTYSLYNVYCRTLTPYHSLPPVVIIITL